MKRFLVFFSLYFVYSIFFVVAVKAQKLDDIISGLKTNLGEVIIDKTTYNQSIEFVDEAKGKVRYESVAVTEKGEMTKSAYEFYIPDIDKNTLVRKPSGKKFFVTLWLNNKQKFIKYYKNDNFEAYTDNLEIQVMSPDMAQNVIDLLKSAIPLIKNAEKTWNTAAEALSWLQANIGNVKQKAGEKQQSFSYTTNTNLVELTVNEPDAKGTQIEEKFNWNVTDLNKSKILVKVAGTTLLVTLETKNSDKYIRYEKGGVLQNYVSGLEIASDDIDHARNIIAAFNAVVDKSKPVVPVFKTQQAALEYLKTHVGEVASEKKLVQKIDFGGETSTFCTLSADETDSKGKVVTSVYEFYLADASPAVVFRVSGKKIIVPVKMAGENEYVRYTKDKLVQNYVNEVEIYMNDIETAREAVVALTTAVKASAAAPMRFNTVAEAMKFIQSHVEDGIINGEQYNISFEGRATEPYGSTYTIHKTDTKGVATSDSFVFYPYTLDVNNVKVETSGKYLAVNVLMAGKKPYVKKIRNNQSSFGSELSIMCFDVKKAKDIASAFRFLSANTTPKGSAFANRQAALDFVQNKTGETTASGKTIKQKVEQANDNPCKITVTVTTTDDKGKTTEEIYEFTLLDINKQVIEYKPVGPNVVVTLSCKNKQKLIKFYKDGDQQSFTSDVELLYTDIDVARNISDAVRMAAGLCE
jgi:hypothetical protein